MKNKISILIGCVAFLSAGCSSERRPPINEKPTTLFVVEAYAPDAPAGTAVAATAIYTVVNEECIARDYTKAIGGVKLGMQHDIDTCVEAGASGVYRVLVFDDFFKTSRLHFWKSKCKWELAHVKFAFSDGSATRSATIGRNALVTKQAEERYCTFKNVRMLSDACSGRHGNDPDYFSVTITRR